MAASFYIKQNDTAPSIEAALKNSNGSYFKGNFLKGLKHGKGEFTTTNGNRFEFTYESGNILNTTQILD